jgi:hypothetical protein
MGELALLRPSHPVVLANHAGALALNGRGDEALGVLRRLEAMRVVVDLSDKDYDSLRGRDDFRAVEASMTALRTERVSSARDISHSAQDLMPGHRWDERGRSSSARPEAEDLPDEPGGALRTRRESGRSTGSSGRQAAHSVGHELAARVEVPKGRDEDVALFAFNRLRALIAHYNPRTTGRLISSTISRSPDGAVCRFRGSVPPRGPGRWAIRRVRGLPLARGRRGAKAFSCMTTAVR